MKLAGFASDVRGEIQHFSSRFKAGHLTSSAELVTNKFSITSQSCIKKSVFYDRFEKLLSNRDNFTINDGLKVAILK